MILSETSRKGEKDSGWQLQKLDSATITNAIMGKTKITKENNYSISWRCT